MELVDEKYARDRISESPLAQLMQPLKKEEEKEVASTLLINFAKGVVSISH